MAATQQKRRGLTSILIDGGIVTPEQVELALVRQVETGCLIGEALVELGFTTEENIAWALSKQLGIPYADVRSETLDRDLVNRFGEALLRRVQAVPLFRSHDEIVVATTDPTDPEPLAELREAAGSRTTLVIGCPSAIRNALDSVYGPEPPEEKAPRAAAGPGRFDIVWDRTGTGFLMYHLHTARDRRASEIHFIPSAEGLSIQYRTDKGLEPQGVERQETSGYLRQRLAALGAPDVAEGAGSAWGSIGIDVTGARVHIGVFHCRADSGVTTVLRLTPIPEAAPDLSKLGLSPLGEAEIHDFVEGPEGLVIVHGPPRSGGSTVLASLAALAARPERRALVLEPSASAPYAPGTTRVRIAAAGDEAAWERLAVGLGADIVVLDDVLRGAAIEGVLSGASVGRLVFARTDWLDGRRLLAHLAESRHGRIVLRDRPFAMVKLPSARREGSGVWTAPTAADEDAGILEATILTDEDRDAILAGGPR